MKRLLVLLCVAWPAVSLSPALAQPVPVTWRPPTTCSTSDFLKWNGSAWVCSGGAAATASGTSGRSARFTGSSALGTGAFTDDGTNAVAQGTLGVTGLSTLTGGATSPANIITTGSGIFDTAAYITTDQIFAHSGGVTPVTVGAGGGLAVTNSATLATADTATFLNIGRQTDATTNAQNGVRISPFTDGNNYLDFKTYTNGHTYLRFGSGAANASGNAWMTLDHATGLTTFPFAVAGQNSITAYSTIGGATNVSGALGAGNSVGSTTAADVGWAIGLDRSGGSVYLDSKLGTGASLVGRIGAGTTSGQTNVWLQVDGSGNVTLPKNVSVGGNLTAGDTGSDGPHSFNGYVRMGDTATTAIDNNLDALTLGNTGTGITTDSGLIKITDSRTETSADTSSTNHIRGIDMDLTPTIARDGALVAGATGAYGLRISSTMSNTGSCTGSESVCGTVNNAIIVSASGGDNNHAIATSAGNVVIGGSGNLYVTTGSPTIIDSGWTSKFSVIGASGNTSVGGTLNVTGNATFNGQAQFNAITDFTNVVHNGSGNFTVADAMDVTGNLATTANTTIGDANTDTLTITAKVNSNVHYSGTAPAPTSCGSGAAIVGNDRRMKLTAGTGSPTACTITFNTAYTTNGPICQLTAANASYFAYVTSSTTTVLTLALTGTTSSSVYYISCDGYL